MKDQLKVEINQLLCLRARLISESWTLFPSGHQATAHLAAAVKIGEAAGLLASLHPELQHEFLNLGAHGTLE